MDDDETDLSSLDLRGLSGAEWLAALAKLGEQRGFFEPLGNAHSALFVEDGDTLLVSFETLPGIRALSDDGAPLGLEFVRELGWSHLALIASGDTWFRSRQVYAFFDQINDDGFFDEFSKVIFYGAGPCGYAAVAYSVSAPGAIVLALQPQATLNPRVADWDPRFAAQRRMNFTHRYGYAPEMMDAAQAGYVLFDPRERLDAMHAALFAGRNVTHFRLPFMGSALQTDLIELDLLFPLIRAAADDTLNTASFAELLRVRRDHVPYLRRLLAQLETNGRTRLAEMLCTNVVSRLPAPRFHRKLEALRAAQIAKSG
ncbi:hypothetical protein [Puniceibacterium sp. IMCC21224]|uniref:hypothetical protein n=1 Tax=Puniceibacterium sp. IMCC21224 TaxID=1618204 RepID=UPI00064DABD5|nr:hypothetical protein [Puniceibacterium sp. IMCC21224]KMK67335.1 hypothetical protein IMCC21224_112203 [Puniceibacterium sp. IMCC21224]